MTSSRQIKDLLLPRESLINLWEDALAFGVIPNDESCQIGPCPKDIDVRELTVDCYYGPHL